MSAIGGKADIEANVSHRCHNCGPASDCALKKPREHSGDVGNAAQLLLGLRSSAKFRCADFESRIFFEPLMDWS